jgi:hypothetical protein
VASVEDALLELGQRAGEPGVDPLWVAQQQVQISGELSKLQARLHEAEADAAAIPFPGEAVVSALREAVGRLEAATGRATALTDLAGKVSAVISAWQG